jgi:hypothetical protein
MGSQVQTLHRAPSFSFFLGRNFIPALEFEIVNRETNFSKGQHPCATFSSF